MSERTYYNTNYNILYQNIEDVEKSDKVALNKVKRRVKTHLVRKHRNRYWK